jgi:hypothetical protein
MIEKIKNLCVVKITKKNKNRKEKIMEIIYLRPNPIVLSFK